MMEVFTKVERGYWQDEFILELTPEQKFFYLYLMTNNKVRQAKSSGTKPRKKYSF